MFSPGSSCQIQSKVDLGRTGKCMKVTFMYRFIKLYRQRKNSLPKLTSRSSVGVIFQLDGSWQLCPKRNRGCCKHQWFFLVDRFVIYNKSVFGWSFGHYRPVAVEHYRPVAVATVVSKLLEHFILSNIFPFLGTKDNQFGFKAGHSTD